MEVATWVQILNEAVYISLNINILGKDMNPVILPPVGQIVFFNLFYKVQKQNMEYILKHLFFNLISPVFEKKKW